MTQANSFDTAAHRLLDDLDARHDQLLLELDELDARVEQVLSQYTQVRTEREPGKLSLSQQEDTAADDEADIDVDE